LPILTYIVSNLTAPELTEKQGIPAPEQINEGNQPNSSVQNDSVSTNPSNVGKKCNRQGFKFLESISQNQSVGTYDKNEKENQSQGERIESSTTSSNTKNNRPNFSENKNHFYKDNHFK